MVLRQDIIITSGVLLLQAMALSVFWIVMPRKRRWNRGVTYGIALSIYGVNLLLNIGSIQMGASNALGFLGDSLITYADILPDAGTTMTFRVVRLLWAILMTAAICWIVCRESRRRKLAIVGCNLSLLLAAEMIMEGIVYVRFGSEATVWNGQWAMLQSQASIIFLGLATISATFWHQLEPMIRHNIGVMIVLLEVTQCAFMIGMWGDPSAEEAETRMVTFLACSGLAVLADFLIFETIAGMLIAQNSEMALERMRQQQETEYEYYRLMQANTEDMTRCCQVLRRQLTQMQAMVDSADEQQREQALREINLGLRDITPVTYCTSPVINAIVTVKADEAQRRGIDMQVQAEVDQWNVSEIDQSNLFSNLLDNALEGCVAELPHPFIRVKAGEQRGFYFVRVSNSCDPSRRLNEDGLPKTTKKDARHHGYGLRILRSIADRYHGDMELECKDGVFTVTVFLENNS